jgi:hypothetical protein
VRTPERAEAAAPRPQIRANPPMGVA